jgi:hypothetical protein
MNPSKLLKTEPKMFRSPYLTFNTGFQSPKKLFNSSADTKKVQHFHQQLRTFQNLKLCKRPNIDPLRTVFIMESILKATGNELEGSFKSGLQRIVEELEIFLDRN